MIHKDLGQFDSFGPLLMFFDSESWLESSFNLLNSFQQSKTANWTGFWTEKLKNSKHDQSQLLELKMLTNHNLLLQIQ